MTSQKNTNLSRVKPSPQNISKFFMINTNTGESQLKEEVPYIEQYKIVDVPAADEVMPSTSEMDINNKFYN